MDFILKQRQEKIFLKYNHLPNFPQNHSIKFYFKNEVIELSPIETLKNHKQLKFIRNKNHNFYKLLTDNYFVKSNFKPGFKYLYFDFINHAVFKKKSKIALVANRGRDYTNIYWELDEFLEGQRIPFLTMVRDSQNYIRAQEKGLGIYEMAPGMTEVDRTYFEPIIDWLNSKKSR